MSSPPKRKRAQKTNSSQKAFMVQYLSDHPILVTRKLSNTFTIVDFNKGWSELTSKLNDLGPSKDAAGWKKYWLDLKGKSKLTASQLYTSQGKTGGGEGELVDTLTPTKQKIVSLIGGKTAVRGDAKVEVFGFDDDIESSQIDDTFLHTPAQRSSPSNNSSAPPCTVQESVIIPSTSKEVQKNVIMFPSTTKEVFKNCSTVSDESIPYSCASAMKSIENSARKNLFETICPRAKKLKSNSERGSQILLSPIKDKQKKNTANSSRDRELIRLQKEHNELLAQRNAIEEKRIELKAARNVLLEARNEIESKKVDALNNIALNVFNASITNG